MDIDARASDTRSVTAALTIGDNGTTAEQRQALQKMVEPAVYLTPEQRHIVEQTVRDHCAIRKWTLHAVNARSNHIHAIVHADRDPEDVRDQLKAWCSRKLSDAARLTRQVAHKAGRKHWFTEGGDIEFIRDDEHLNNAIRYVLEGQ